MSFSYYVEPRAVVGDETSKDRQLYTGLGSDHEDDDREAAVIGIFEDDVHASIELTKDELEELIVDLIHTLAAMGQQA